MSVMATESAEDADADDSTCTEETSESAQQWDYQLAAMLSGFHHTSNTSHYPPDLSSPSSHDTT